MKKNHIYRNSESRIPPGQVAVKKWPKLHVCPPEKPINFDTWRMNVFGNVSKPKEFSFKDLLRLDPIKLNADVHCVTHWSLLDNQWEGVPLSRILKEVSYKPDSKQIMCYGLVDYSTNLDIEDALLDSSIIAWRHNGSEINHDHGGPIRFVIPHLYLWKSAKWASGIEVMNRKKLGFWEVRGYHNKGDPWREERFS